ncbi:MAG TPA: RdgB/HAM1 family non-canonical purine NTP pyrophosphatase [Blastocatellia bacterium]|jgi:XTP/dITP diphosphohydrolase|nr:RdgB/HAM1 family non-canonical purine NTP pyrophosphatase [Blastocatellia bacterium]
MKLPDIDSLQSAIKESAILQKGHKQGPQSAIDQSAIHTLLIATSNKGKVAEIASLLEGVEGLDCRVIGLEDLPQVPPPVEETGTTFAENALIKADYYHAATGLLTLADDSGLEVDALGGRPGVYSARYGGGSSSADQQVSLLLEEMKGAPEENRTARFVCVIALAGPAGEPPEIRQTFEGRCEGKIARAPRGAGGFGYDPIFIDTELGRTFAELSSEEKSSRSHRGKALRDAIKYLEALLKKE